MHTICGLRCTKTTLYDIYSINSDSYGYQANYIIMRSIFFASAIIISQNEKYDITKRAITNIYLFYIYNKYVEKQTKHRSKKLLLKQRNRMQKEQKYKM